MTTVSLPSTRPTSATTPGTGEFLACPAPGNAGEFIVHLVNPADHRVGFASAGRLDWRRSGGLLEIVSHLSPATLSDSILVSELSRLVERGAISGQDEFEQTFVSIVSGIGADRRSGWHAFYANSLRELRAGGADFSPVHRRARSLLIGHSVLEVGCCFGFFALQCAQDGRSVTATDICPGALEHLDDASANLGLPVDTIVGDARGLPFAANSFDTVTLLHLLEHLRPADVDAAILEACRVAVSRVVIAVPYEDEASSHFGHLDVVRESDLRRWSRVVGAHQTGIFTDHGGWLVIDLD